MTAILVVKVSVGRLSCHANSGYKDTPCINWLDVNECLNDNGGCESTRTCTNTAGGRICGNCPSGFVDDGDTGCTGLMTLAFV